jgi:pyruvate dehydrogenase E1 component alpha subunit
MSDPAKYRAAGELEEKKKHDGLKLAEDRLTQDHGVTEGELEAIREEVKRQCQEAYDFADASPVPDPADLYAYTYAPGE